MMTYWKMIEQTVEVMDQRLEFRHLPESDEGLIAIHEFVPALPWCSIRRHRRKPISSSFGCSVDT
ncbi:hypothetical protein ABXV15_03555 [Exiguobacterium profundum]|uniref:hypothetical protein n=1 Tax=Exiguobacterium profundum TaxID=307643 RepID=UPI003399CF9A